MAPQIHVVSNPNQQGSSTSTSMFRHAVQSAFNGANGFERVSILDLGCQRFLRTEGRGYRTSRGATWVDSSGRAWDVDSVEFTSHLAHEGGAPAGAADFIAAVKGAARTVCLIEHQYEARAMGLSALGSDGAIYFRRSATSMFRVDSTLSIVPNGSAGLLLRPVNSFDDVPDLPPPTAPGVSWPWMLPLCSPMYLDSVPPNAIAAVLGATLICLLLPRELAGVAPAPAFIGPAGSGKTSAARACAILLSGRANMEMPPDAWSTDSFETALSRSLVMPVDDFDQADPKFAGVIRSVITGAQRTRRRKYSDDDLHVLEPDVRLLFATNDCPLPPTEANVSRLLPIRFAERTGGFLVEGALEQQAHALRAQFWADSLETVRQLRPMLSTAPGAGQRLAGWERFVRTMATGIPSWGPSLTSGLALVDQVRSDLQLADDSFAEYISYLVPTPGCAWQGSASQLLLTFRQGKSRSLWSDWTAERVAKHLRAIVPALRKALGIHVMSLPRSAASRGYLISRQ